MTPQSHFTLVAPIAPGCEAPLRALLAAMNRLPGSADPDNAVVPFGAIETLHYARLVVIDDAMQADLNLYGVTAHALPTSLAMLGDCDGPAAACLALLAQRADAGLRRLFSHCEGFGATTDLLGWMHAHDRPVAVAFVCRLGRTVRQVREESALWRTLATQVSRVPLGQAGDARRHCRELVDFIAAQVRAGRLTLTDEAPTPPGWRIANLAHGIGVPLVGLLLLPLVVVALPFAIAALRRHETSDPEYCPRPDAPALRALQDLEDHDLTNQFTAIGPVKPGRFRRRLLTLLLILIDYACRHVYHRGYLARVQTIHFARWVVLDDGARVLFASNYDGGHEAYMDDFINKVGWGLNLVFSNGVGWPRTDWLVRGGARREPAFKRYQRRHQVPTQVWYKAYPGLTLSDIERAGRIRAGMADAPSSDARALAWLRLL